MTGSSGSGGRPAPVTTEVAVGDGIIVAGSGGGGTYTGVKIGVVAVWGTAVPASAFAYAKSEVSNSTPSVGTSVIPKIAHPRQLRMEAACRKIKIASDSELT
jgi:hypothetical protein